MMCLDMQSRVSCWFLFDANRNLCGLIASFVSCLVGRGDDFMYYFPIEGKMEKRPVMLLDGAVLTDRWYYVI